MTTTMIEPGAEGDRATQRRVCPSCGCAHDGGRNTCDVCRTASRAGGDLRIRDRFCVDRFRITAAVVDGVDCIMFELRLPTGEWRKVYTTRRRGNFVLEEELRDTWLRYEVKP